MPFRLPTEAEWEFAARGGNKSKGYKYSGSNNIDNVAWYGGGFKSQTHDIKNKQSNELGLYDMSGNLFEWCQDRYGDYCNISQTNPIGPTSGCYRTYRGGNFGLGAKRCRVSCRGRSGPEENGCDLGLRLAL